ncbi:MAG: carboxypeptidase-like regulatory domain-containing protein, partial [Gaiellales bacterium]
GGLQSYAFGATRTYWLTASGPTAYPVCYDWVTGAACAGFAQPAAAGSRYTLTLDSQNPDCGFTYGDNAVVTTFNARFGGTSCAGGPSMSLTSAAAFPRLGCDGSGSLKGWGTIKLTVPGGVTVTAFRVTILDSSGTAIPGFSDMYPNAQGVVDASGLSVAISGQMPTISVGAVGATLTQAQNTTITATYVTDYPQLCVPLEVKAACPTSAPGFHAGGTTPLSDLAVTGNVREVPASGPTVDSTVTGSATRAGMGGCNGSLSGTVKYTTGVPLPYEDVELRAPDGTLLATVKTDAQGRYAFPQTIGPATGYRVVVKSTTKSGDVMTGQDTVIDFLLPVPAPVMPPVVSPALPTMTGTAVTTTVTVPSAAVVTQVGTSTTPTAAGASTTTACTAKPVHAKKAGTVRITCTFTRALLAQLGTRSVRIRMVTRVHLTSGKTYRFVRFVTLHRRGAAPSVTG